jgi:hypothetical protein
MFFSVTLPRLLVIFFVIIIYIAWAQSNDYPLYVNKSDANYYAQIVHDYPEYKTGYYQQLTQAFLKGQLYLPFKPHEKLLSLSDPFNYQLNGVYRGINIFSKINTLRFIPISHDLSLYHNKYYMYFGPLPVFALFMPFKLIVGGYPSDSIAIIFFLTVGFIFQFLLLIKIKNKFFPDLPQAWILFCGLILGLTNNAAFLLSRIMFYEVSISSAYFAMNIAIFCLYNLIIEKPKVHYAFLFGLFLALCVGGRPQFALLNIILIPLVIIYFFKRESKAKCLRLCAAMLAPGLTIACLLAVYNYERFGSITEFGTRYMLLGEAHKMQIIETGKMIVNFLCGLYSYVVRPYYFDGFDPRYKSIILPQGYSLEHLAGVVWTAPYLIFLASLPALIMIHLKKFSNDASLIVFTIFLSVISLCQIVFLCLLNCATQRYVTDFLPYFIMLVLISIFLLIKIKTNPLLKKTLLTVFVVLSIISMITSLKQGFYESQRHNLIKLI